MANRIRRFIESVVYAGLKPSGGVEAAGPKPPQPPGPLRDKIQRFLSGGPAASDPLYLTNRTWMQKLRLPLAIVIPTAALLYVLALVFGNVYAPKTAPPKEPTAAEILKNLLPDLQKNVDVEVYKDAEIVEIHVVRGAAPRIVGALKNNTDRVISVEFDVTLADASGSQVGTLSERVEKAPPGAQVRFDFPASSPQAAYAIVRKMRTVI
jgi:hypothetical protein